VCHRRAWAGRLIGNDQASSHPDITVNEAGSNLLHDDWKTTRMSEGRLARLVVDRRKTKVSAD